MHDSKIQIHQTGAMWRYQALDLIDLVELVRACLRAAVFVEHETRRTGHPPDTCPIGEAVLVLLIEFTIVEQQRVPWPRGTITA